MTDGGGQRASRAAAVRPDRRRERGRSADALWETAIARPARDGRARGRGGVARRSCASYDEYSLYEFLRHKGCQRGRDRVLRGHELRREPTCTTRSSRSLREDLGKALRRHAGDRRRHGPAAERVLRRAAATRSTSARRSFAIDQDADGVDVHYKTEAGRVTVPRRLRHLHACRSPCCGSIEVTPTSRTTSARAIRQLNYHASTKILFQVRDRIWEKEDGIFGGATVTDLPIRRMNYPTRDPSTSRGVLLASYTWGQDALQWGAMDEETRLEEALDDVARIHPRIRDVYEVRRVARLVRRSLGTRRVRPVRARAADRAPGRDRRAGGPRSLRRRALLALPRLDPGRARVGHPRGAAIHESRTPGAGRRDRPWLIAFVSGPRSAAVPGPSESSASAPGSRSTPRPSRPADLGALDRLFASRRAIAPVRSRRRSGAAARFAATSRPLLASGPRSPSTRGRSVSGRRTPSRTGSVAGGTRRGTPSRTASCWRRSITFGRCTSLRAWMVVGGAEP